MCRFSCRNFEIVKEGGYLQSLADQKKAPFNVKSKHMLQNLCKVMKTPQVLTRKMGEFDVLQRTSDGYFDANVLLSQWNSTKGNSQRKMTEFSERTNTNEFIDELKSELVGMGETSPMVEFQAIKKTKGRMTQKGKTKDQVWMHPYLFLKFSMWINPRFEVRVIRFVHDQLIEYRNEAGNSYRELSSAICKLVGKDDIAKAMAYVAKALNYVIYNNHEKKLRNKQADELSLKDLCELQKDITKLINFGFINTYDQLRNFLSKRWIEKWKPNELTA